MSVSPSIGISVWVGFLTAGVIGAGFASAGPPPSPPGPGEPGYCGAHTSPLDCWADTGPITPGETAFVNEMRGEIPGDDTRLLQVGRGTCQMLTGGTTTSYIVADLARSLGVNKPRAGQVMDAAMDRACPGLVVGTDGVARPRR